MLRVGIDIGGTFTDVTAIHETSGETLNSKSLTSTHNPADAVIGVLDAAGVRLAEVKFLSHGTTIGINMIIERTGARTGIVTTKGFRDVLELRHGARTHLLDPQMELPFLFVPRRYRAEVLERMTWRGEELEPLDQDAFVDTLKGLVDVGVESVAVSFLHSYANRQHEKLAALLLSRNFPGIAYTLSSDIDAEIGEFERTSTAALNAYIHPGVQRYLANLEPQLRDRGLQVTLHVMQSNGGILSSSEAAQRPIRILESSLAAGSAAAAHLGSLIGIDELISFDMGGTTAKASVIERGRPQTTVEYELFQDPGHPGSGWPIRVPMIDIIEVGAGGGSVAWLDEGGDLRVGPRSAGAEPGPVCYGRGGTEPTVTDANAVVGRLSALLGGRFTLDIGAAKHAIERKLARPLGLSVEEAAAGILEINDARAADLLREVTIARGRDPRDYSLIAFGGAGPMAAPYLMTQAGMKRAIVPPMPGTFSALGLLLTDMLYDGVQSHIRPIADVDADELECTYTDLARDFRERLLREGLSEKEIIVERSMDLRYEGQFHVVSVGLPSVSLSDTVLGAAVRDFHAAHLRMYLHDMPQDRVELVNLRIRVAGRVVRPGLKPAPAGGAGRARIGVRPVYFRETRTWLDCGIYRRALLGNASVIDGPAVIEEDTATSLIPPGFRATVDRLGNLIIETVA
jgi:N-methylhydantoinase A